MSPVAYLLVQGVQLTTFGSSQESGLGAKLRRERGRAGTSRHSRGWQQAQGLPSRVSSRHNLGNAEASPGDLEGGCPQPCGEAARAGAEPHEAQAQLGPLRVLNASQNTLLGQEGLHLFQTRRMISAVTCQNTDPSIKSPLVLLTKDLLLSYHLGFIYGEQECQRSRALISVQTARRRHQVHTRCTF